MNYYELEPEKNTFKTIIIQTTYKCQMSCSNCYLGDMLNNESIPDIDYNKFSEFLKKLPSRCDIRFLGAEPTLNPELPDLIHAVRKYGHRPSMLTNGLKLYREPYVKELKDAGINTLGLSMNGGINDKVYQIYDNGKYARQKKKALEHCFKYNIVPHINIIVTPLNLHVLKPLLDFIVDLSIRYKGKIHPKKFPVMLRPKSIGKMGNYLDTKSYNLEELAEITSVLTKVPINTILEQNSVDGYDETGTLVYSFKTKAGLMLCKITDWTVDEEGVIDGGSWRRGILTDTYKIAPAFEYYAIQVNRYDNREHIK